MRFRVEMTKEEAKQILQELPTESIVIRYGISDTRNYRADRSGHLQVVDANVRPGGNAGRIIVIRGFLTDEQGKRKAVLKHYPRYLPPKGMTLMTFEPPRP
jgi:hypothetical protein